MKEILVVAATQSELDSMSDIFLNINQLHHIRLRTLVSGVGAVSTTFNLTRRLCESKPDLILNIGIAGAFDQDVALGSVFQVTKDCFADLGAEDKDGSFMTLHQLKLEEERSEFDEDGFLESRVHFIDTNQLPLAVGATVNTVHGYEPTIAKFKRRIQCDIESMEGAGALYTSLKFGVPLLQIRAISNHVTSRDRASWKIALALKNLTAIMDYVLINLSQIRMEKAPV